MMSTTCPITQYSTHAAMPSPKSRSGSYPDADASTTSADAMVAPASTRAAATLRSSTIELTLTTERSTTASFSARAATMPTTPRPWYAK